MSQSRNLVLGALIALAASSPHTVRAAAPATRATTATTATIVLEVSTFRNLKGFLGCQLYPNGKDFPDNWKRHTDMRKHVPVTGTTTSCSFADMPPGTYAAAVIHDENSNGKLDKNFLGMPTEGYGISNNHTHAFSRPTWDESKFDVKAGTIVTSHIKLRY